MLINQINNDRMTARLENNTRLSSLLTTLFSEASAPGFNDGKRTSTDAEVIKVIKRFRDNAKITLDLLTQSGGEAERIADAEYELSILDAYLPTMMTDDELRDVVTKIIKEAKESGVATNIGSVMAVLRTNHAGLYDGTKAKNIIVSLL